MNELSKELMCIQMRSGVEIWIEKDRIENLGQSLQLITTSKFIQVGEEYLNTADIVGMFKGKTMDAVIRKKNGQKQCSQGNWHDNKQQCDCLTQKQKETLEKREAAIKNCGKCKMGYILSDNKAVPCKCIFNSLK